MTGILNCPKPIAPERHFMQFYWVDNGFLSLLIGEDIRVTGVENGHGAAAEELTTGGTELNL